MRRPEQNVLAELIDKAEVRTLCQKANELSQRRPLEPPVPSLARDEAADEADRTAIRRYWFPTDPMDDPE